MLEAVAGLVEKGSEVETVVPAEGELSEHLRKLGVAVHVVPLTWWVAYAQWSRFDYQLRRLARNLYSGPQLYRLLRKAKPDLVVSNTLTIPAGAFAARQARIPHVWYVHEFGREGHGFHFDLGEARTFSLMNKLSAKIMTNSRAVAESLMAHIPSEKLRVVYQAVEVPPQPPTPDTNGEVLRLIYVGRLATGKRQEDAIRALASLVIKGLRLHLTLVGPDVLNYGRMLQNLVRELQVSPHVDFVGPTNDPFAYMTAADVAVICSEGEAFGRVTIEAMKLGKPVIGANSGGTAELISSGETGLIFAVGDSEDLARKIEILYHDSKLRNEIGAKAQAWATGNFSREKYAADLLEVFREVLQQQPVSPS